MKIQTPQVLATAIIVLCSSGSGDAAVENALPYIDGESVVWHGTSVVANTLAPSGDTDLDSTLTEMIRFYPDKAEESAHKVISPEAISFLGQNSAARLARFLNSEPGWHFGKGERLSQQSLKNLNDFSYENGAYLRRTLGHPSVFLAKDGGIDLLWNTTSFGSLFLKFADQHIEYAIERDSMEGIGNSKEVLSAISRNLTK